jgi:hypothetical protein
MAIKVSKEQVKQVIEDVEDLDLPDGAHWSMIHERLDLAYGRVFEIIAEDPGFFGYAETMSA